MTAQVRRCTAALSGTLLGLMAGVIARDLTAATEGTTAAFCGAGLALGVLVATTIGDGAPAEPAAHRALDRHGADIS